MAINTENGIKGQLLFEAIRKGVRDEVEFVYEEHKKEMIKRLDMQKDQIVSGIVLHLMKYVQMETMKESIVITIKKIEDKNPTK